MKKTLSLVLVALILLSICGCSSNTNTNTPTEKDDRIQLTLDNYKRYLKVTSSITSSPAQDDIKFTCNSKGTTNNFNYYDIEITFKVSAKYFSLRYYGSGNYGPKEYYTVDEEITINEIDITGSGWLSHTISPSHRQNIEYETIEIIAITGYVEPA